ncbi:hypothetical protein SKAU_G00229910 [Synaphobranchus kaupii]|uniref:CD80-like immunoglobulin C2-set domain-containing protein n=1 Tax=Synaphobranchus kaupii TaxID=118154 RepID=A0A9Q1F5J7_SYNKA|nr:hypothetical protein SKAU_G00229910 [Synaphobranchus kaupii]
MVILGLVQVLLVFPQISTRLDFRDGKRVAVCSATGGKPAASISWRNTWNSSVTQSSTKNPDGSFTVESRLILSWREGRLLPVPEDKENGEIAGNPRFLLLLHPKNNSHRMWKRLSPMPATYSASTQFTTLQLSSAMPRAVFRNPRRECSPH